MRISDWSSTCARPIGAERGEARLPLTLFFGQLVINVLWSFSFFGQRNPFLGLICLGALGLAVVLTTLAFQRVSTPAGWLFLPYLLWLGYAGAPNVPIRRLHARAPGLMQRRG